MDSNSINTPYNSHDIGAATLRITLGTLLLAHGLMKIYIFTIPGTVAYFGSIGLPPIAAYLTMFGEVAGGVAIISGIFTRLASALTIPLLAGATWAHSANGWVFSNAGGGWEFPAILVMIALVVTIQGGGAFSLSRLNIATRLPRFVTA